MFLDKAGNIHNEVGNKLLKFNWYIIHFTKEMLKLTEIGFLLDQVERILAL